MYRGLILGGLAFAAVFTAERQLKFVAKDIERYDRMRAMSGEPSFLMQGVGILRTAIQARVASRRADVNAFLQGNVYDVARFARISAM